MKELTISSEHTKKMNELIDELGFKETKELLEKVQILRFHNPKGFNDPNVLIKRMQKIVVDFKKEHFDYFVEKQNARKNPIYFKIGFFSEDWFKFIKMRISDPLDWIEEKIRCFYHDVPVIEEKLNELILEQKKLYIRDEEVLKKINTACVYIFKGYTSEGVLYKIGKSNNISVRKKTLKKEYNHEMFLINAISCENSENAFDLEREIHFNWFEKRRFVEKINGSASNEWFKLDEQELKELTEKYDTVLK